MADWYAFGMAERILLLWKAVFSFRGIWGGITSHRTWDLPYISHLRMLIYQWWSHNLPITRINKLLIYTATGRLSMLRWLCQSLSVHINYRPKNSNLQIYIHLIATAQVGIWLSDERIRLYIPSPVQSCDRVQHCSRCKKKNSHRVKVKRAYFNLLSSK